MRGLLAVTQLALFGVVGYDVVRGLVGPIVA
jgi:hypothetical protein